MYKACTKCKENKKIDDFYRNKDSKDGHRSECKVCGNNRVKEYRRKNPQKILEIANRSYQNNKEKVKSRNREYRQNNKEKVAKSKKEYSKKYYKTIDGFVTRKWNAINRRTMNGSNPDLNNPNTKRYIDAGIMLKMSIDEFRQFCVDSWDKVEQIWAQGETPSVDRIDSGGHYEIGNIRIVSLSENLRFSYMDGDRIGESGFLGVKTDKNYSHYARISNDGKRKYLGTFRSPKMAALARDIEAICTWGWDNVYLNFEHNNKFKHHADT